MHYKSHLFLPPSQHQHPSKMSDMEDRCKTNPAAKAITKSLKHDPTGAGFTHLATDGVLRSFDGDRNVIDYRPLSPEEIAVWLEPWPPALREKLIPMFEGVDGRNVTDVEQLLHPRPELLPPESPEDGLDDASSGGQDQSFGDGKDGK
ncbi:hypothetical protein BJY01DRAFT_212367 [Aspergillus pseudoustus]|uniref:Uncharacterized protein n=1 Tax=Aspergillus pseudoustus TaxID=1810923 RepID=A0ABR4K6L1_9EURO